MPNATPATIPDMEKVTIYHNPACSKSRATLALLEQQGIDANIRLYLKDAPKAEEIQQLLTLLGMSSARELMRKGEAAYKDGQLADAKLTETDLINAMVQTPKLIERPIVINKEMARIGRPPKIVLEIL